MILNETLLGNIATFKYGSMPQKKLISFNGFPIFTGYKYVGYYPTFNIDKECIIVVARGVGGTGDVKICPARTHLTNLSIAIELNNDFCDLNYFFYSFKLTNLRYLDSGSAQSQITINDLKRIKINLPLIKVQKLISNILKSFDDKIQLNIKINKNLEELAQTLYKRWFVDFEFPNEKGEPYKSSDGEMVNSELGLIPKGWEVRNVSDLFVFIGGSQPPKEEHKYDYRPGYVRFIQNRDFKEDPKHITFIKDSKKNKMANKLDILIDKYGEVGQIRFGIEGAYNVALAKLEPHLKSDLELLRGYFSQREIREYLSNSSIASTRGSLNSTTFTGLKIAYPSKLLIKHFSEFNQYLLLSILNKKSENKKLAELRDLLLPKLMSGEIEVPLEE
jgi:type I restriction enzyme, S subunit